MISVAVVIQSRRPSRLFAGGAAGGSTGSGWRAFSRAGSFSRPRSMGPFGRSTARGTLSSATALLTESLSSAYTYQKATFDRARSSRPHYNVAAHDGDWHDNQLLYYLADQPYILTDDENIRTKCQASPDNEGLLLKAFWTEYPARPTALGGTQFYYLGFRSL